MPIWLYSYKISLLIKSINLRIKYGKNSYRFIVHHNKYVNYNMKDKILKFHEQDRSQVKLVLAFWLKDQWTDFLGFQVNNNNPVIYLS